MSASLNKTFLYLFLALLTTVFCYFCAGHLQVFLGHQESEKESLAQQQLPPGFDPHVQDLGMFTAASCVYRAGKDGDGYLEK